MDHLSKLTNQVEAKDFVDVDGIGSLSVYFVFQISVSAGQLVDVRVGSGMVYIVAYKVVEI